MYSAKSNSITLYFWSELYYTKIVDCGNGKGDGFMGGKREGDSEGYIGIFLIGFSQFHSAANSATLLSESMP
jgi:hypothetical protein